MHYQYITDIKFNSNFYSTAAKHDCRYYIHKTYYNANWARNIKLPFFLCGLANT